MHAIKKDENSNRILIPNELKNEWLENHNQRIIELDINLGNGVYWLIDFDEHTIFASPLDKSRIDKTADEQNCSPLDVCMDIMRENNAANQMLLNYYKIAKR